MDIFEEYLTDIKDMDHQKQLRTILEYIGTSFPSLEMKIAWNQPMFTDHDTYIIGFSFSKLHIAVAPEAKCIQTFANQINEAGYQHTTNIIKIKWNDPIDYSLLSTMIQYNIDDKATCTTFWRK